MKQLANNTKVQVHYRGTLADGEEFDSSFGKGPLAFTIGAGEVLAGFENAVKNLEVGQKTKITLSPEQGYGQYKEELVLSIPKTNFPPEIKIEPGANYKDYDLEMNKVQRAVDLGAEAIMEIAKVRASLKRLLGSNFWRKCL